MIADSVQLAQEIGENGERGRGIVGLTSRTMPLTSNAALSFCQTFLIESIFSSYFALHNSTMSCDKSVLHSTSLRTFGAVFASSRNKSSICSLAIDVMARPRRHLSAVDIVRACSGNDTVQSDLRHSQIFEWSVWCHGLDHISRELQEIGESIPAMLSGLRDNPFLSAFNDALACPLMA